MANARPGACPDCGHNLVLYRSERQQVGQRSVVLEWHICPHCRHVALANWSFLDPVMSGAKGSDRLPPRDR